MGKRVPIVDGGPAHRPLLADAAPIAGALTGNSAPLAPDLAAASATPSASSLELLDANGDIRPLRDIEAEAIRFAIRHCHGRMSQVARRLRIGRSTLYRKLDSLGLDHGVAPTKTPAC
jgi:DNA-binding NtrC family response regulator